MSHVFALLQAAGKIAERGDSYPIAPDTLVGWISPVLGLLALIAIAVGWGKWIERFNGLGKRFDDEIAEMGGRVKETETGLAAADAEGRANAENIRTLISQHTDLIEKLGKSERSTEACRDDTEKLGIDLGNKISTLTSTISALDKSVSNRLVAIETTLRIKPPKELTS